MKEIVGRSRNNEVLYKGGRGSRRNRGMEASAIRGGSGVDVSDEVTAEGRR